MNRTHTSTGRGFRSSRFVLVLSLTLVLSLSAGNLPAQGKKWFTAYYPVWAMRPLGSVPEALPPWDIDWTRITHVVHFMNGNVSQAPPYSTVVAGSKDSIEVEFCGITNPGNGNWIHWQDSLITIAHRHGIKVCLTIQAVDAKNLNYVAADSARTDAFANYIIGYCKRKGYDGIELDWEGWITPIAPASDVNRMVRRLRAALNTMNPRGLFLMSPSGHQGKLYWASQDPMVDQFNFQMYDFAYAWHPLLRSNASWYIAPLQKGKVPLGFEGQSYETRGPVQWVEAGHDPARLGVGMPTFGWVMKNVDGLFQRMASGGDYGYARQTQIRALLQNGGTEGWDDERMVPFITGTALRTEGNQWWEQPGVAAGQKFFATYENPRSLKLKLDWVMHQNYGGVMLYDLTMDLDPSKPYGEKNSLHKAVALEMIKMDGPAQGTAPAGTGGAGTVNTAASLASLPEDITSLGKPIALITRPDGSGNKNIEVIRDGIIPNVGGKNPLEQFDTYNSKNTSRTFDWIGYEFPAMQLFTRVVFQEGLHSPGGGWLRDIRAQVRRGGVWYDVQNLTITPPYNPDPNVNFQSYLFTFTPSSGDAIRIAGTPGGWAHFISVAELRVMREATQKK